MIEDGYWWEAYFGNCRFFGFLSIPQYPLGIN